MRQPPGAAAVSVLVAVPLVRFLPTRCIAVGSQAGCRRRTSPGCPGQPLDAPSLWRLPGSHRQGSELAGSDGIIYRFDRLDTAFPDRSEAFYELVP